MINELYEKDTMRNIPNEFSINEIDTILKDEYRVTEIEKGKIGSMMHDSYTNFEEIVKCYKIEHKDVLARVFNSEEKTNFVEIILLNQSEEHTGCDEQDYFNNEI
ncbi:hypothetical protein IGW_05368 [Bacillus cereus ISP3191]|uniref:hypothetical protein n=1 Tax=Bacillus cereus group TaxID=86661 RepID=UPI00027956DE|nr:hypothetical protein [Bacillus cereus]EJQ86777.1 hypothetical protein IGW_05368 [Bacillus cereus ISP3191]